MSIFKKVILEVFRIAESFLYARTIIISLRLGPLVFEGLGGYVVVELHGLTHARGPACWCGSHKTSFFWSLYRVAKICFGWFGIIVNCTFYHFTGVFI